jgi:hypothetical protein
MSPSKGGLFTLPRRRPVFGLGTTPTPSLLFLLVGVALGPAGLGLISGSGLQHLQTVVTVALAALGVSVGLGMRDARGRWGHRLFAAASAEAVLTALVAGGGLWLLLQAWHLPIVPDAPFFAALAAISVAASAAGDLRHTIAHVADLDDVALIVAGSVLLAAIEDDAAVRLLLTVAAAVGVGLAGHLLFEGASEAERGVFIGGAILLLGGIGAYLRTSPLLSGFAAALVWVRLPSDADRITAQDLQRLQHPLLALLLIVAGASVTWSLAMLWIGAALLLLRLAGKLLASLMVAPLATCPPIALAEVLLPPGVIGIALGLNTSQILDLGGGTLLGSIALAVALSEAAAIFFITNAEEGFA